MAWLGAVQAPGQPVGGLLWLGSRTVGFFTRCVLFPQVNRPLSGVRCAHPASRVVLELVPAATVGVSGGRVMAP